MLYDCDEDFDLAVAPKRAHFSPLQGGASRHLMVNGSSERVAIKVKCSNNRVYRISPVYTVLDPGCAQRLQIVRDPGDPAVDKLILLYTQTTGKNAREVFAQVDKRELRRLLIALVAKGDEEGEPESSSRERARQARTEGGSAGRGGDAGSSTTGQLGRTDTRDSIPLIDE